MCPAARKNEYQKPVKCFCDAYSICHKRVIVKITSFQQNRSKYLKLEGSI